MYGRKQGLSAKESLAAFKFRDLIFSHLLFIQKLQEAFFFFSQLPVGFSALNELVEMKKILTTPASSIKSRSN